MARARSRIAELENELLAAQAELTHLEGLATDAARLNEHQDVPASRTLSKGTVCASSPPDEKLAEFTRRFLGRQDAYATRWVSRKTGKAG